MVGRWMGIRLAVTVSLVTILQGMGLSPLARGMAEPNALCPSQLGDRIMSITQQPGFERSRWGIVVQTLRPSSAAPPVTLYEEAATQFFVPASNIKLLTTAAALAQLGANFRVHTSMYWEDDQAARVDGYSAEDGPSLRVVGQGDPSVTLAGLLALAQQVRDRGITHINRLVLDDRYFHGNLVNATWEWEDVQAGYGAPVNSLIVNQNEIVVYLYPQAVGQPLRLEWANPSDAQGWQVVNQSTTVDSSGANGVRVGRDLGRPVLYIDGQLRAGSDRDESAVAIPDPTAHFGRQLRQALEQTGIRVNAVTVAEGDRPSAAQRVAIATLPSPPLSEWLQWSNRDSNNLATESLLRQLAAVTAALPTESTLAASITQLSTTLAALGVDPTGYQVADGSGLSRRNWVSPLTVAQTLQAMAHHPLSQIYRESLAIAATSGTLHYRFQNTAVAGRLWGKSGGLTGVAALSGYLDPPQYQPLVFSIMVNYSPQPGWINRQAIDDIVLALSQLHPCVED